jgi:hypothetical protein
MSTGYTRLQELTSSLYRGLENKWNEGCKMINITLDNIQSTVFFDDTKVLLICVDCVDLFSNYFLSKWYKELCKNDLSGLEKILLYVDPQIAFPVSELQMNFGDNLNHIFTCHHNKITMEIIPVLDKILQI